jgi:hypothetical protein
VDSTTPDMCSPSDQSERSKLPLAIQRLKRTLPSYHFLSFALRFSNSTLARLVRTNERWNDSTH